MHIFREVYSLSQKGKRENNEDYFYPQVEQKTPNNKLFMVCDGVGGSARGEVASKLAVTAFSQYFANKPGLHVDEHYIDNALCYVEEKFDDYLKENPLAFGMGTTLTLLYFEHQKAIIAHCGDSRIYHIRNNQIMYVTADHSLVSELVRDGIITAEEAVNHPRRNVITRAIQGTHKATKVDTFIQADVEAGDCFFLCSDGILESLDDDALISLLGNKEYSGEEKIEKINEVCNANSRDNYTCILVEPGTPDDVLESIFTDTEDDTEEEEFIPASSDNLTGEVLDKKDDNTEKEKPKKCSGFLDTRYKKGLFVIAILAFLIVVAMVLADIIAKQSIL